MGQFDNTLGSSEGVFAARPGQVAALLELGTSGDGEFASASSAPARGTREEGPPDIPGYEIAGKLGEGGMGTVWRAVQLSTRREVALKLVGSAALGSHRSRLRFDREVELAARLEHPHIARVYDSGSHAAQVYYAMELVEGLHLDQYVKDKKPDRRQVLQLMGEVCRAVQHAHQKGVIHRDLKPSNILVTADGRPRVLDFGLAKALGSDAAADLTLTQEGSFAGTPAFMSPEQAAGRLDKADTRSDVYSLGATLFMLLTGQHAHDLSGPRYEVARRIASDEVRRPRRLDRSIDAELEALLLKALAHDPERRYASAGALAADIDRYLNGEPLSARRPTLPYVLRKRLRKHWAAFSLAATVVALLLGMGVYSYFRESRQRRIAEANERQAELHLALGLVAQGEALGQSSRWGEAKPKLDEAHALLTKLGEPTFRADLAMWNAHLQSPPPLLEFKAHDGPASGLAYLPGGEQFVSAGEDGQIVVWDALTGYRVRAFAGDAGQVSRLALSPDGRLLACAAMDRGLTLWDVETGGLRREIKGFSGGALGVAFSPDGSHMLVGSTEPPDNACLFETATGKLVRRFTGHLDAVTSAVFTPKGDAVVTAGGRKPGSAKFGADSGITLWDVGSGALRWSKALGSARVTYDLALTSDGGSVMSGAWGVLASFQDLNTGKFGKSLRVPSTCGGVRVVATSPDGVLAATGTGDGSVVVWRVRSETAVRTYSGHAGAVRRLCFSPDGQCVLSAGDDGMVRLWPVFARPEQQHFGRGDFRDGGTTAFSPDGRLMLSHRAGAFRVPVILGAVTVYDAATQVEVGAGVGLPGHANHAVFAPDGGSILICDPTPGTVGIWDLALRRRLGELNAGRKVSVDSLAVGGALVLGATDASDEVLVWDLPSRSIVGKLKLPGTGPVNATLSADGKLAAATLMQLRGRNEGILSVTVWETATGRARFTRDVGHGGPHGKVAFSPDGRLVACAGDALRIIDAQTGDVVHTLTGSADPLFGVTFTPDGLQVFAGGEDRSVTCWDVRDGARVGTFDVSDAGASFPFDLAVSADGSRLLPAQYIGYTGGLCLWDLSIPVASRRLAGQLGGARRALESNSADGDAWTTFGEWYALRGMWPQAVRLLKRARVAGATVAPLTFARCYWKDGNAAGTRAEFAKALGAARASGDTGLVSYLELCVQALASREAPADRADGHWYLAEAVQQLGNGSTDLHDLMSALETRHPVQWLHFCRIANRDFSDEDGEDARAALARALARVEPLGLDPRRWWVRHELFEAYQFLLEWHWERGDAAEVATLVDKMLPILDQWIEDVSDDSREHRITLQTLRGNLIAMKTPFRPETLVAPGVVEAEAFDDGGEGVGYHDQSGAENTGSAKNYRQAAVDLDVCLDAGGGHNVGGIKPGEWLAYTIQVKEAGDYVVDLRLASPGTGGTVSVEFDGLEPTGPVPVPDTGGWQQYQTVSAPRPVRLPAGRQLMRVRFNAPDSPELAAADGHICNLNWIQLRRSEQ